MAEVPHATSRSSYCSAALALVSRFRACGGAQAIPAAAESLETVTVTATRVIRDGYEAPTPTTVLGADMLTLRAPSTLANALSRLPQMRNAADEGTGSLQFGQSSGRGFANLRGLGTNRTLVLLDGERLVSNSLSGDRDILSLPSALITRVEVVTGGASASYGSDAIAGVVNFLLDSRFSGLKTTAEGGMSSQSDAETGKVTRGVGRQPRRSWSSGRECARSSTGTACRSNSRSFATPPAIVPNPGFTSTNGQWPLHVVRNAVRRGSITRRPDPRWPACRPAVPADGTTAPYVPSSCNVSQPYVLCDSPRRDLAATLGTIALTSPQRRVAGFSRLTFQATPDVEAWFDVLASRNRTAITSVPLETSEFGLQLPIDVAENPFLPDAVRSPVHRCWRTDVSHRSPEHRRGHVRRCVAPIGRKLQHRPRTRLGETWRLQARASYAQSDTGESWRNIYSIDRFVNAVDAVLVNGTPTCRINAVTMTDPACAPADIFGSGNMSAAAKEYFLGTIHKPLKTYQRELALHLTGQPLSLWAGPVSVAAGADYRKERARQFNDGENRGFAFAGFPAFSGDGSQRSLCGSRRSLLHDRAFARSMEADLAARWVNYSQAGSELPWKLGLNWVPVQACESASRGPKTSVPPTSWSSICRIHVEHQSAGESAAERRAAVQLPRLRARRRRSMCARSAAAIRISSPRSRARRLRAW